jgi:gluconate 2-dehydrogenase alpha chain
MPSSPGKNINGFIGAGGNGVAVDDFNGDTSTMARWASSAAPIWCNPAGAKPISGIAVPTARPSGARLEGGQDSYLNTMSFDVHGANMVSRRLCRPRSELQGRLWPAAAALTFDWKDNDIRMSRYVTDQVVKIAMN